MDTGRPWIDYFSSTRLDRDQLDNTGSGPLKVPGTSGIDLDASFSRTEKCFENDDNWDNSRATAREIVMVGLINEITDRPDWHQKVFDEDYVAELEIFAHEYHDLVSERTWAWCLKELRLKARKFEETGRIASLDLGSGICKLDSLVSSRTHAQIQKGLKMIHSTRRMNSDEPIQQDEQIQQLIDPSLYPLVFGQTPVLLDGGKVGLKNLDAIYNEDQAKPMPVPNLSGQRCSHNQDLNSFRSQIFGGDTGIPPKLSYTILSQWLPCEVEIAVKEESVSARIASYINNLHPKGHGSLYSALEDLIALAIPAWNEVLVMDRDGSSPMRIRTFGASDNAEIKPSWYDDLEKFYMAQANSDYDKNSVEYSRFWPLVREYLELPELRPGTRALAPEKYTIPENWEDNLYAATRAKCNRLNTSHPEPGTAYSFDDWTQGRISRLVVEPRRSPGTYHSDYVFQNIVLEDQFREQGLQIIVKATTIELPPFLGRNKFSGDDG